MEHCSRVGNRDSLSVEVSVADWLELSGVEYSDLRITSAIAERCETVRNGPFGFVRSAYGQHIGLTANRPLAMSSRFR